MITPLPPARVSAIPPTRQSRPSTPVSSASPPATPPITLSVRLRRSWVRGCHGCCAGEGGGQEAPEGSAAGEAGGGGVEVMAQRLLGGAPRRYRGTTCPDPESRGMPQLG